MEITLRVNYWLIRKILEQNNRTYLIVAIPIMRFFITLKPKPLRVDSILLPSLPHYFLYWKLILHNIYRIFNCFELILNHNEAYTLPSNYNSHQQFYLPITIAWLLQTTIRKWSLEWGIKFFCYAWKYFGVWPLTILKMYF